MRSIEGGAVDRARISARRAVLVLGVLVFLGSGCDPGVRVEITSPVSTSTVVGDAVDVEYRIVGAPGDANHVHFRLDGGPELMDPAPIDGTFRISGVTPGAHTLDAFLVRVDHGRIAGSDARTVTFYVSSDPGDPAAVGSWSSPVPLPTVAVDLVLLHTGKILLWAGEFATTPNFGELWDPVSNAITPVPNPFSNIFCSSHVRLADGRILVAGGHDLQNGVLGLAKANSFDPISESWTALPPMAFRRWYPTLTALGDGRAIVVSGSSFSETEFVETPEIYDPVSNAWTTLVEAPLSIPQYPIVFLLPDGRLLQAGSTEYATPTRTLDLATRQWTTIDPRVLDGGAAAMFSPSKIVKAGSASVDGTTPSAPSSASTYVLDMTAAAPAWRETAPMASARTFHNLTMLPDGSALVTGGSSRKNETDLSAAVYTAEMWSAATETWSTLAPMTVPRIYHSSAVLLPDARVAVAGGGNIPGGSNMLNAEIYSPPYLFKGPRPAISSAPDVVRIGSNFAIGTPDASRIRQVSLVRPGAATHGFDQDQRFVPLLFSASSASELLVQAPLGQNLAPPGHYMLFLVDALGVPSVAKFVRIPAPYEESDPPTAPSDLEANAAPGAVGLAWSPATDASGVVDYEVHRSASAGVVPTPANRIGVSATTSHLDGGLAPGTYYYVVVARDAVGNRSAPSNEVEAVVPADSSPPSVEMTAPADGAVVSGVVMLAASASDDVGVVGVQFRLDGLPLGAEDLTPPWTLSWSTAEVPPGSHSLTAVARDAAGNTTESSIVRVGVSAGGSLAGLVAAYSFEEGVGPTSADLSGLGHVASVLGPVWTAAGRSGGALVFDGVDDTLRIASTPALSPTQAITLSAWVRPAASPHDWRTLLLKEAPGSLDYALYADAPGARPEAYVDVGSAREVVGAVALAVDEWSHLAATWDGSLLSLYVNGSLVSSRAVAGALSASGGVLRVGGNAVWGEYFAGVIDEVRIYDRALAAAEIVSDMDRVVAPLPQPTRSSPIVLDEPTRRIWVVNPDHDSVTSIDADSLERRVEIAVGKRPTSLALDAFGQLWVSCRDDDTVWSIDARTETVLGSLTLAWGSAPTGIVFTPNGVRGFVAAYGAGRIHAIDPVTGSLGGSVDAGPTPDALAVSGDGQRLLVTQFITTQGIGRVRSFAIPDLVEAPTIELLPDSTSQDGSVAARGIANYLAGLAIAPDDSTAFVAAKKDNLFRGLVRDGRPLSFETTVRALVGVVDLDANQELLARRTDLDDQSQPSAIAIARSGARLFVTLQGNDRLLALDASGLEVARAGTGRAPQGVVIDESRERVVTHDFLERTTSFFDASVVLDGGTIPVLPLLGRVSTVSVEALSPEVLRGKRLFYAAGDSRISRDGYLSCAVCHLDGGHDGQVWDFTDRGEGLRNTASLRGQGGSAGAPLHWSGNFDEVQDFEGDIRNFFGGTGLMSDSAYFSLTRSQPLGAPKAGLSEDLDALAAYVDSLSETPRSPWRQPSGASSAAALAGAGLFASLGCGSCHSGMRLSDSPSGLRHDVGTIRPTSGQRLGGLLDGIDTPMLPGVAATAPYLHDGSAATLRDVLVTANPLGLHGNVSGLSAAEIDSLVEYLLELEFSTPSP